MESPGCDGLLCQADRTLERPILIAFQRGVLRIIEHFDKLREVLEVIRLRGVNEPRVNAVRCTPVSEVLVGVADENVADQRLL